ncbi:NADPH:quinone reductase [Natronosalvus halobius]|uniref:NADPH:quinone reductase n=1 Tax=Natronosalvus halobius TaxID=2953746 RepID=UPI0020A06419|nr:NADPH:quinone reductase [Natronosalvus halobius]USZ73586.1 NADPH:quinone reductase [Natronosalvus halobius]
MRAARFHETGGPEQLQVESVPNPSPRPDEILVEVRAIGVNPTEVYSREGDRDHPLPRIPGADFAGIVESVGETVTDVEPGDRVFGTGLQNDRQGTYAEYVVARPRRYAVLPDEVSFEQGAAAGVVGTTAWLAFVEHARLTPTSTCFIHGGSGGVGHVAVQTAKLCGATVVTTAGSEASREFARECGADTVLDYARPDLLATAQKIAPDGVDVVLDHRIGSYLQFDLEVLAPDGTVVVIGGPQDESRITDMWPAIRTDATVQVFAMSNEPDLGAVLEEVAVLLADGRLDIHIARRYDLEDAAAAQRAVIEDSFHGKLIILP